MGLLDVGGRLVGRKKRGRDDGDAGGPRPEAPTIAAAINHLDDTVVARWTDPCGVSYDVARSDERTPSGDAVDVAWCGFDRLPARALVDVAECDIGNFRVEHATAQLGRATVVARVARSAGSDKDEPPPAKRAAAAPAPAGASSDRATLLRALRGAATETELDRLARRLNAVREGVERGGGDQARASDMRYDVYRRPGHFTLQLQGLEDVTSTLLLALRRAILEGEGGPAPLAAVWLDFDNKALLMDVARERLPL